MISFTKYEGAGNDFIMVDNRTGNFPMENHELVHAMCDRHFGIGADGLILLQDHPSLDFEMIYYNADGHPGSMCGNGGRCITLFARDRGFNKDNYRFMAADGEHDAYIIEDHIVQLGMNDVREVEEIGDALLIDTGSPHYLIEVDDLDVEDFVKSARAIRFGERFKNNGVNVNFIKIQDRIVNIRTYERGVEDETLACGTGITAAAIAVNYWQMMPSPVDIVAKGGRFVVSFINEGEFYTQIRKQGPARKVFEGVYQN